MKRIILILIFAIFFVSCKKENSNNPLVLTDDLGKEFVFENPPQKIISLAPSITEALYFINADKNLIGVTKYCDYPQEAKQKTIIGGILDPNIELITKLNPDLIFLTTEGNSEITYRTLTGNGMKVFVINPKNIQGITDMLEKLNKIFKTDIDNLKINKFKSEITSYNKSANYKTCAAFISIKPLITFNKTTYLNDVFKFSGFKNEFEEEINSYPNINDEMLVLKNPEYIFIFADTVNYLSENIKADFISRYKELRAVKNNRVLILDENVISRPGPRIVKALEKLKSAYEN